MLKLFRDRLNECKKRIKEYLIDRKKIKYAKMLKKMYDDLNYTRFECEECRAKREKAKEIQERLRKLWDGL